MKHLDDRRQAVGGAAGVGDDVVLGRIVLVFVDAEHDGDVFVGGGSGDDDLFTVEPRCALAAVPSKKTAGNRDRIRAFVREAGVIENPLACRSLLA